MFPSNLTLAGSKFHRIDAATGFQLLFSPEDWKEGYWLIVAVWDLLKPTWIIKTVALLGWICQAHADIRVPEQSLYSQLSLGNVLPRVGVGVGGAT